MLNAVKYWIKALEFSKATRVTGVNFLVNDPQQWHSFTYSKTAEYSKIQVKFWYGGEIH
jgi:hypothetical protein